MQRYLFYCNRYMNHMQSLRFEHKLYAQVKQKMEEMQQHNMSWIEVQFLKKAVDVLCQCRSTLMFTYVFAFYLKKNNQSIIFEVRLLLNCSVVELCGKAFIGLEMLLSGVGVKPPNYRKTTKQQYVLG